MRYLGLFLLCLLLVGSLVIGAREGAFDFSRGNGQTDTSQADNPNYPPTLSFTLADRKVDLTRYKTAYDKLDNAQKQFTDAYIAAVNASDVAAYERLMHPASIACHKSAGEAFMDYRLSELVKRKIELETGYLFFEGLVQHFEGEVKAQMEQWYTDPVDYTHTFVLYSNGPELGQVARVEKVAALPEGEDAEGEYRVVLGCPTKAMLWKFRLAQAEKQQKEKQVSEVLGRINEELKSELEALIKGHKLNEAVRVCEQKCNVTPSVSYEVILRLQKDLKE
jgi:hypothetical protein